MNRFDKRGQKIFKDFLKHGELAWENVVSLEKPELGILDFKRICAENIETIYEDEMMEERALHVVRKNNNTHTPNQYLQQHQQPVSQTLLPLVPSQVTYCNSDEWEEGLQQKMVRPYILRGQLSAKKLGLMEDSSVIDALKNAPERLVFNIPVGNMDAPTKERYMNQIMQQHKKKKGVDAKGNITEKYNPISITEDFYFPVDANGNKASIDRVGGSSAFSTGFNGMIDYFHKKIYEAMGVPVARLNPDATMSDGTTITMQELGFAERVIQIQNMVACAVKESLIVHLKLKGLKLHNESCNKAAIKKAGEQKQLLTESKVSNQARLTEHLGLVQAYYYSKELPQTLGNCGESGEKILHELGKSYWDQYELKEEDIKVEFSLPTNFLALREQQLLDLKSQNFANMSQIESLSPSLLLKRIYSYTDGDLIQHREWQRKEAEFRWELSQIEGEGPGFREKAQIDAGISGGGSALPSGGDGSVSDFGNAGGALDDLGSNDSPQSDSEPPTGEFGNDGGLDDLEPSGGEPETPKPDVGEPDPVDDEEEI